MAEPFDSSDFVALVDMEGQPALIRLRIDNGKFIISADHSNENGDNEQAIELISKIVSYCEANRITVEAHDRDSVKFLLR